MAKNSSIGIDIGSNGIKVVLLKKTSNGVKIEKIFIESYNTSSKELSDNEVKKSKIKEVLGKIFKEIKPLNIVVGLAKGEDNIRAITAPLMQEKSFREALKWGGLPEYIPFDLKEMIWDVVISQFHRRKEEIKTDGKEKMDVVLALAKREIVNNYLDIIEMFKASVDIVESNILASINFSCFNQTNPKDKIWGKIDLGAEAASVNILEGNDLKFSLNIPWGVNDIIETAQAVLNKSWQDAEQFVQKIDFSKDITAQDEQTKQVLQNFEPKLKDFLRQLNGALNFYESRNPGKPIIEIILSGGGAKLTNMSKFLTSKTGKEFKILNAINKNLFSYEKKDEEKVLSLLPLFDCAIGAALRNLTLVRYSANLLPLEIMIGRKLKTRRLSMVGIVSVIILSLVVATVIKYNERKKVLTEIKTLKDEYSKISEKTKELYVMKSSLIAFKEIEREYSIIKEKMVTPISGMIYELTTFVPDKTWVNSAVWNSGSIAIYARCKKDNNQSKEFADRTRETKYYQGLQLGQVSEQGNEIIFSAARRKPEGRR